MAIYLYINGKVCLDTFFACFPVNFLTYLSKERHNDFSYEKKTVL